MTAHIAALWRHPIKAHGREPMDRVRLIAGLTMPWDRRWAVAHEAAKTDGTAWAPCPQFSRGAKAPALMTLSTQTDEASGTVTLHHPDHGQITFDPDGDISTFLDWVRPLMPADRAASARMVRVPDRGMTDTDYPSISLLNLASNAALSDKMGVDLSMDRWRGNIHMSGLAAWAEKDWIGKTLRIGTVELQVREEITRCLATTANPETGLRDADTLGALNGLGHQEFGVYAVVTKTGEIACGDEIEVL